MLEGLPPNGAASRMRLACDEATARRVADIIVETHDPAETAAAAFEDEAADARQGRKPWMVDVYFGRAPDVAAVRALVALASDEATAAAAVFGAVEQADWVGASLAGLAAVREGRFVVHGAHCRDAVGVGDIGIEIEAALAFGTGHHGTTRGCLAMLNDVTRRRRPARVLDVGTGTGVLAIAAARRLRRRVVAGDIDPIAVVTARQNAIANGAAPLVRPVLAKGLGHPAIEAGAPYDLIFANILAPVLRRLARDLVRVLSPRGEIVLSGLLLDDAKGVVSAFRTQGLALVKRRDIEGWATLLMRRPPPVSSSRAASAPAAADRG